MLATDRVSLTDLVAEIAHARVDQATAGAQLPPRFTVAPLHDVEADPVLVRQLLENLLGNAIKYTAPGVVPHVTVSTEPVPGGWVRLEISDNGIGIPAGQHEAIFANFHRAHRDAGFAGTGLGLAIVRDVAEIYGGSIALEESEDLGGLLARLRLPGGAAEPMRQP